MKKVIIASDSHSSHYELEWIVERHEQEASLFLHCGDSELASDHPTLERFRVVRGNCDYDQTLPLEVTGMIDDETYVVVHGHKHQVKSTLMPLKYRAEEVGATIVCFGHSHLLGYEYTDGVLYINPGSVFLPRGRKEKSYVCLTIADEHYHVAAYEAESGTLLHEQTFGKTFDK